MYSFWNSAGDYNKRGVAEGRARQKGTTMKDTVQLYNDVPCTVKSKRISEGYNYHVE